MIIKPPIRLYGNRSVSVFLAGTIDNGDSEDWQANMSNRLSKEFPRLDIYNPRRDNWSELDQSDLQDQIQWELDYLKASDIVFFNFLENSKSPVTMLELGLMLAGNKNCVISCPMKFYRYQNVLTTALEYNKTVYTNFDKAYNMLEIKVSAYYR